MLWRTFLRNVILAKIFNVNCVASESNSDGSKRSFLKLCFEDSLRNWGNNSYNYSQKYWNLSGQKDYQLQYSTMNINCQVAHEWVFRILYLNLQNSMSSFVFFFWFLHRSAEQCVEFAFFTNSSLISSSLRATNKT